MVLVIIHTYNGGYGDETQLLGIYDNLAKAHEAKNKLIKYYVDQSKLNEDKVVYILRPEFIPCDFNRTYSIHINDECNDFAEPLYDTDLPRIYLGGYIE